MLPALQLASNVCLVTHILVQLLVLPSADGTLEVDAVVFVHEVRILNFECYGVHARSTYT